FKDINARIGCVQDPEPILAVANLEIWLINTVNQELVTSYTVRVKHVRDLVIHIELPVSDGQRQIEGAGAQGLGIGRIIYNVQTGKTQPYVATSNIHTMIVVKLRFTPLIVSFFKPIIGVGA